MTTISQRTISERIKAYENGITAEDLRKDFFEHSNIADPEAFDELFPREFFEAYPNPLQ